MCRAFRNDACVTSLSIVLVTALGKNTAVVKPHLTTPLHGIVTNTVKYTVAQPVFVQVEAVWV